MAKRQIDVERMPQATDGMTQIANDNGVLRQIDAQNVGGGSSVRPDWNQNDPNAADYVKNRTHYSETVEKSLETVSPFTFTVDTFGKYPGGCVEYIGTESEKTAPFPIIHGYPNDLSDPKLTQTIVFDGVEYTCRFYGIYTGYNGYCYGNLSLYDPNAENTGEPFLWMYYPKGVANYNYAYNLVCFFTAETVDTATKHTIAAYSTTETEMVETVHKIDPKYLNVTFVVNFNSDNGENYTVDKTYAEIVSAIDAGQIVIGQEKYPEGIILLTCSGYTEGLAAHFVSSSVYEDGQIFVGQLNVNAQDNSVTAWFSK